MIKYKCYYFICQFTHSKTKDDVLCFQVMDSLSLIHFLVDKLFLNTFIIMKKLMHSLDILLACLDDWWMIFRRRVLSQPFFLSVNNKTDMMRTFTLGHCTWVLKAGSEAKHKVFKVILNYTNCKHSRFI